VALRFDAGWITTPLSTTHSEVGTPKPSAAAETSIARAAAPARRIGSQASRTLVLPPVPWTPSSAPNCV